MNTQIPCTESGCQYVAQHKKEVVAKRMIGMHRRNAHGIIGEHAARNGTGPLKVAVKNGISTRKSLLIRSRVAEPRLEKEPTVLDEKALIQRVLDEVGHCPRCGKNLQRLLIAEFALAKHEQTH